MFEAGGGSGVGATGVWADGIAEGILKDGAVGCEGGIAAGIFFLSLPGCEKYEPLKGIIFSFLPYQNNKTHR
jgi:hypothetical protein